MIDKASISYLVSMWHYIPAIHSMISAKASLILGLSSISMLHSHRKHQDWIHYHNIVHYQTIIKNKT